MHHYWYMVIRTKITVVQNEFRSTSIEFIMFINDERAFTSVKLKTNGHGGEVCEGLLHERKGSCQRNFQ